MHRVASLTLHRVLDTRVFAALALSILLTLSASAQPNPRAPDAPVPIKIRAYSIAALLPSDPAR